MAKYLDNGGNATPPTTPVTITPELASALEKINAAVPVISGQTNQADITIVPYTELTPAERKLMTQAEKVAYLKAARDQADAIAAAERASSDPMFDFTVRPDAPSGDGNYINYYSWVGDTQTGSWKLYRAPNTPENQAKYGSRSIGGVTQAQPGNPSGANTLVEQPVPIKDASGNLTAWQAAGTQTPISVGAGATGATGGINATGSTGSTGVSTGAVNATGSTGSTGATGSTGSTGSTGATGGSTGATGGISTPLVPAALTYKATDGTVFTDQAAYVNYQKILTDKATSTAATDATNSANRQSAYDLMYAEFSKYGLGSLVQPLQGLIQSGASPSEFSIKLRESDAYKKRFSANEQRISKGLKAISEAEYIGLEDQYQNILRNAGLPESYWKQSVDSRTGIVSQEGFANFIANDVSAVELEDRVATAQQRLIYANPEVSIALKTFYPDITNGDLLAYALDPTKGLDQIKRRITAAEVGSSAVQMGLATNVTDAEYLARYGVTKAAAQQGYSTIANGLERGSQLASIYGENPYTQTTAEQEVFNVPGAAEARKQRQKITGLEKAAFGGQSGLSQGALARDRAGGF